MLKQSGLLSLVCSLPMHTDEAHHQYLHWWCVVTFNSRGLIIVQSSALLFFSLQTWFPQHSTWVGSTAYRLVQLCGELQHFSLTWKCFFTLLFSSSSAFLGFLSRSTALMGYQKRLFIPAAVMITNSEILKNISGWRHPYYKFFLGCSVFVLRQLEGWTSHCFLIIILIFYTNYR